MQDNFYDRLSFEDHVKMEFHDEFRRKKAHFLQQFLPNGGKLLDVGCGSGFDLKHLAQGRTESRSGGCEEMLIGLDISMNMLQQTGQYLASNGQWAHLVQRDARALPFRADTFDLVHSHELSVFNYGRRGRACGCFGRAAPGVQIRGTIVTVLPQRDQEGFLPTGEPQMRYLFRSAGISFVQAVYNLGKSPWLNTPRTLALLHRVVPSAVARRLLKSPEEYLGQEAFMIIGVGEKVALEGPEDR